ncbi:unnamed protein product, partial [Symbiodinium pilosum]
VVECLNDLVTDLDLPQSDEKRLRSEAARVLKKLKAPGGVGLRQDAKACFVRSHAGRIDISFAFCAGAGLDATHAHKAGSEEEDDEGQAAAIGLHDKRGFMFVLLALFDRMILMVIV